MAFPLQSLEGSKLERYNNCQQHHSLYLYQHIRVKLCATTSLIFLYAQMPSNLQRDNSVITLDVANCRWKLAKASGDIPPARCYHTAAVYNNLMIIHGGEGIPTVNTGRAMAIEAVASVDSEEGEVAAPHNRSFTRGSVVDADRAHDQLVSGRRRQIGDNSLFSTDESDRQLNGSGAGRVLSGKDVAASAESCAMDHAQAVGKSQAGPMHGVTLGDTLTSPSLVPAPKVYAPHF